MGVPLRFTSHFISFGDRAGVRIVLLMIKHDINTIPLLTLKTSSITHPAKIH